MNLSQIPISVIVMLLSYRVSTHLQRHDERNLCNNFTVHDILRILSNCILTFHLLFFNVFCHKVSWPWPLLGGFQSCKNCTYENDYYVHQ